MNKLHLLLLPLAMTALPVAAQAQEAEQFTFEHAGDRYVYTVKTSGNTKIIDGTETRSGKRFSLRVGERRVTGTVGSSPVSFRRDEVTPLPMGETFSDR